MQHLLELSIREKERLVPPTSSTQLIYFISGMWCGTCAKSVRKSVHHIAGVVGAELNYASKLLIVTTNSPHNIDPIDLEIQTTVYKIGFGIKKQSSGWILGFQNDLRRESEQKLTWLYISIVWFLAMWSSMLAFAGYLGDLSRSEHHYLSIASCVFGLPAILLGIIPYARAGVRALYFAKILTLDFFIFVGGLSAISASLFSLFSGGHLTYADSGAMILSILLLTKKTESLLNRNVTSRILYQIHDAKESIEVYRDGRWVRAENTKIRKGHRIRLSAGETIPFDGQLESKDAAINHHLISGENAPVSLKAGDDLLAGTIAITPLEMIVRSAQGERSIDVWAEASLLAEVQKTFWPKLFAKIEESLTLVAGLGAVTIAVAYLLKGASILVAVEGFFIGVLVFCPCLFASIIPLTRQMAHLTLIRHGIMLHRSEALLDLARAKTFYFDKTGTLEATESSFVYLNDKYDVIPVLSALAKASTHVTLRGLSLPPHTIDLTGVQEIPGQGLIANTTDGAEILVGRLDFLKEHGVIFDIAAESTYSYVAMNREIVGYILRKTIYDEAVKNTLKHLLQTIAQSRIEILSGDPKPEAGKSFCDLDSRIIYFGNLRPHEKAERIKEHSVFIGDGLNDTLALAKADVGIRLGHRVSGFAPVDFQLQFHDLNLVIMVVRYAKKYRRILIETCAAAFVYNVTAFTLAILGIFTPLGAVMAMAGSFGLMLLSVLRLQSLKSTQPWREWRCV